MHKSVGEIDRRVDERRRIDHVTRVRGRRLLPALPRHLVVESRHRVSCLVLVATLKKVNV